MIFLFRFQRHLLELGSNSLSSMVRTERAVDLERLTTTLHIIQWLKERGVGPMKLMFHEGRCWMVLMEVPLCVWLTHLFVAFRAFPSLARMSDQLLG